MFGDLYGKIRDAKTVQELENLPEPGFFERYVAANLWGQNPGKQEDYRQQRINELYSQQPEALATIKRLSDMAASGNSFDPNFTGQEWVRGMMTTPALGGIMSENDYDSRTGALPFGKKYVTQTGDNPVVANLIQLAQKGAQEQADTSNVTRATFEGKAPDANMLTRFLTSGSGQMMPGEKGTGGTSLYDKIMAGSKQTNERAQEQANLVTMNTVGTLIQNPEFQKLAPEDQIGRVMSVTGITDPAKLDTILKTANIIKDMKLEEVGTGKGEEKIKQFTDKFGRMGGTAGQAYMPSAPKVTVNNYVKAFEETEAKGAAEDLLTVRKGAKTSQSTLSNLNALENLLDGVETGKLTTAGMGLAQIGSSFGLNLDPNLGAKEAAQAIANKLALAAKNAGGDSTMPGSMSDGDRLFLVQQAPSLNQSAAGRKQLIDVLRKTEQRSIQVAKMYEQYRQKHKVVDSGFYSQLSAWADRNPLFPKPKK